MNKMPTVSEDLQKILDYLYSAESKDFIYNFDRDETEVELTGEEMANFADRVRREGSTPYEDLATERANVHIFGSIVRVGRQLLRWD